MAYQQPHLQSSYRKNNLGKTLYDLIRECQPEIVIEFGSLNGYSAACIGQALRDNGHGKLIAYDLWEKYPHKHSTKDEVQKTINTLGLENFVELRDGDFYEWVKSPEDFDVLHVDVSNTGDTVELLKELDKPDRVIVFEGGSKERDDVVWMKKYNKKPIVGSANYVVIDERFPSLSIIV